MTFEWDTDKNAINKQKHGISFELACKVFLDSNRIEIYDYQHSTTNEDRYNTIGLVGKVLFVVYTERHNNIRLISARLANSKEKEIYYGSEES